MPLKKRSLAIVAARRVCHACHYGFLLTYNTHQSTPCHATPGRIKNINRINITKRYHAAIRLVTSVTVELHQQSSCHAMRAVATRARQRCCRLANRIPSTFCPPAAARAALLALTSFNGDQTETSTEFIITELLFIHIT